MCLSQTLANYYLSNELIFILLCRNQKPKAISSGFSINNHINTNHQLLCRLLNSFIIKVIHHLLSHPGLFVFLILLCIYHYQNDRIRKLVLFDFPIEIHPLE